MTMKNMPGSSGASDAAWQFFVAELMEIEKNILENPAIWKCLVSIIIRFHVLRMSSRPNGRKNNRMMSSNPNVLCVLRAYSEFGITQGQPSRFGMWKINLKYHGPSFSHWAEHMKYNGPKAYGVDVAGSGEWPIFALSLMGVISVNTWILSISSGLIQFLQMWIRVIF